MTTRRAPTGSGRDTGQRLTPVAATALRVTLAIVLLWFGALKLTGLSSVSELVASTVAYVPVITGDAFVRLVGAGELALGVWLLVGRPRRVVYGAVIAHLVVASFVAIAVRPDLVVRASNPLLLTVTGQFVAKNIVLVFAALLALATDQTRARVRRASGRGLATA